MIVCGGLILLHLSFLPAGLVMILLASRRRTEPGRCVICEYDLRAQRGDVVRCPECGRVAPRETETRRQPEERILFGLGVAIAAVPMITDLAVIVLMIIAFAREL